MVPSMSPPSSLIRESCSISATSREFCRHVLPLAMADLEEHDEAIAAIAICSPKHYNACTADNANPSDQDDYCSVVSRSSTSSSIASTRRVSSIHRDQLRRINLIGTGRFSNVHLASGPSWLLSKEYSLKESSSKESSPKMRKPPVLVAVKSLDFNSIKDSSELTVAAGELANEAMILSGLEHENIVKLRAVCSETFSDSFGWGGYFLVFEVLRESLCDRLQMWRRQKSKKKSLERKARGLEVKVSFLSRSGSRDTSSKDTVSDSSELWPELDERKQRLYLRIQETVLGITKGMEYLHSNGIVLRDLKPANIGYDDTTSIRYGTSRSRASQTKRSGSTVRLFDFGMAQKVESCDPLETCGSLRYMAPETMNGKGYTLMVDVYSFGVVLYEMCSLLHPFAETIKPTWKQRQKKMIRKFSRMPFRSAPKDDTELVEDYRKRFLSRELVLGNNLEKSVFCPEIRELIEECCAYDPTMRPTFAEIRSRVTTIFRER